MRQGNCLLVLFTSIGSRMRAFDHYQIGDLERRVISHNTAGLRANCAKFTEARPMLSATKCSPAGSLAFGNIWWTTCATCAVADFYRATACNATHGIAVAILSVYLSVRCVYCDKTKQTHCEYFDTLSLIHISEPTRPY